MNKYIKQTVKQNTYPMNPNIITNTWMSTPEVQSQDHIYMIFLKSSSSQLLSTRTASHRSNSYLTAGCWQKGGPWMVVRWTSMGAINGQPVEGSRGYVEQQRMC